MRKHGWNYPILRLIEAVRAVTDRWVEGVVPAAEIQACLRAAFPGQCFSLSELARKYGFDLIDAGNLNGPTAIQKLKTVRVDLGIVNGTRILREQIFSVPRMGCINLHKGRVPEYRGMPPGFWELYDGAPTAGITVHFIDRGLDTGDVVATSEVVIRSTETPDSLRRKLDIEGVRVLADAVSAIQAGTGRSRKQVAGPHKPRSKPTSREVCELRMRLPHWRRTSDIAVLLKNLYCLFVFYCGPYRLVKLWHRFITRDRGCVVLYHRVNDYSDDILTVDRKSFAAQLLAIRRYYTPISTADLIRRMHSRERIPATAIVVHFDDCYRDVVLNGAPILTVAGVPAAAFISSGFIDTDRPFAHDTSKYPFDFPNLRSEDMIAWVNGGFEVGAHTVSHVDLGTCDHAEAELEVTQSRSQLETILSNTQGGRPHVDMMSFPFGAARNIRGEVVSLIRDAGYTALFSAHGGFVRSDCDPFDIPRVGCCSDVRPLYLLLEIEGMSPTALRRKFAPRAVQRMRPQVGGRSAPQVAR
jgi:peptidoglycan/xylan/chitin deacetylase (PgdA/CDA1 family)